MSTTGITDLLWQRGILVGVSIGLPTFQRRMVENELLFKSGTLNREAIKPGTKELLPDEATRPLVRISSQARLCVSRRGIPFPLGNGNFVTYKVLPTILRELDTIEQQWAEAKRYLLENFDRFKSNQLRVLREQNEVLVDNTLDSIRRALQEANTPRESADRILHERLSSLTDWIDAQEAKDNAALHRKEEVAKKVYMSIRMFKISSMDMVEELDQEELDKARSSIAEEIQTWVRQASTDIHRILGEKAARAAQMLRENGKLTPRNLSPLFEAFDAFSAADFTGKSPFRQTIDQIRSRFLVSKEGQENLELTADAINSSAAAQNNFRSLLDTVGSLALEETADQAGLRALSADEDFKRFVDV